MIGYAVALADATRRPERYGLDDLEPAGRVRRQPARADRPRAGAPRRWRCCAAAATRSPADVRDLAPDVLRHRLVLSYEALSDGVTADDVLERVLEAVDQPLRRRPAEDAAGARDHRR